MFLGPRQARKVKRDFDAPKTLAYWIGKAPTAPKAGAGAPPAQSANVNGQQTTLDPILECLHVDFSAVMEARNGCVYIGHGYPLISAKRVVKLVKHCFGADADSHVDQALQDWRTPPDAGNRRAVPAMKPFEVSEDSFHSFLELHFQKLERRVKKWFRPRRHAPCTRTDKAVSVYGSLPDDIKVVVLYLAFRIEPAYWCGLRHLVRTLDWHYLARLLQDPSGAPASCRNMEHTARRLNVVLAKPVLDRICTLLKSQPTVAHRALAQEFGCITGLSQDGVPSDLIQEKMLRYEDKTGSGLSAICLSGGGIRSASFCLGALQVLSENKKFGGFHYLSTVSGGGYIGTALIRWMAAKHIDDKMSSQRALEFAEDELVNMLSADYVQHRMTGIEFEQEGPLTWLRMNSNYLARQLSIFSADAWTVVATYLRNLVIVWTIFFPWIGVYIMLPWIAVWLGQFQVMPFGPAAITVGVTGGLLGVIGASYFYQGAPGAPQKIYANGIRFPYGDGDTRAAWGALLLVLACYCLSITLWSEADARPGPEQTTAWLLVQQYGYLITVILVTQMTLAEYNIDNGNQNNNQNNNGNAWSAPIMYAAALVASVVQIGLILWIRWAVDRWRPLAPGVEMNWYVDLPSSAMRWRLVSTDVPFPPHLLTLQTTFRSLVTPPLMLVALLLGEGLKAAVRSFTEPPARREHQARAHAFSFMLTTTWVAGSVLVIGMPALLTYFGPSTPAVTAAGSAVSVAVSAWFGYRKSSPGKPEARTPISLSLIGTASLTLLAILVSIGAWKVFELAATEKEWTHPVRCECARLDGAYSLPHTTTRINRPGFETPIDDAMCSVATNQCIDRTFTSYFDEFISAFDEKIVLLVLAILAVASAALYGLSFIIRMNEFSLHGFYRDRLIRAFYGGFRAFSKPRAPAIFTGFDPTDDLYFHMVRPLYLDSSGKMAGKRSAKPPFLVVNTALNLVKGNELAWQERKADSFTMTALHGGNYRLGYRNIESFADGVKLGTAMAISGAAFNPNMGYNSSAPMAFLMSVLNVRLGWWLGNPKFKDWEKKDPSCSSWRLLQEATGQTTDTSNWIHLSDGGHFDNLGLWEMVHRRCRRILIFDAGQDGRFAMEDFYSAIRKIRIDMGITIETDHVPVLLFPRSARASGMYYARFVIRYSQTNGGAARSALDGEVIYMKPCFYGTEPPDVREYAEKHPEFPHESTADQFFNESQFESYRKLGEWEMKRLLEDCDGLWDRVGRAQP